MSKSVVKIYCVCLVLVLTGCVTSRPQPHFEQVMIAQPQLTLQDTTTITVKVNDPYDVVKQVEGVVLEDSSALRFLLHDDGLKGDEVAGDHVWSIRVKVPYDGWAGTFTFEITAYNDQRDPIIVLDEFKEVAPMTTTLHLDVQLPVEEEATP